MYIPVTRTARVDLATSDRTVRDVRALVLDLVEAWHCEVSPVDLVLLLDEMSDDVVATSDGGRALVLDVLRTGLCLRVALTVAAPVPTTVAPPCENGWRSLAGVLADRWGDETRDVERRRWFELSPAEVRGGDGDGPVVDLTPAPGSTDVVAHLRGTLPDDETPTTWPSTFGAALGAFAGAALATGPAPRRGVGTPVVEVPERLSR